MIFEKSDMVRNIIVPISVSTLKALYFTHICTSPDGFVSTYFPYKLYSTNYQLFMGCVVNLTTTIQVQALGNTVGEGMYTKATSAILQF